MHDAKNGDEVLGQGGCKKFKELANGGDKYLGGKKCVLCDTNLKFSGTLKVIDANISVCECISEYEKNTYFAHSSFCKRKTASSNCDIFFNVDSKSQDRCEKC